MANNNYTIHQVQNSYSFVLAFYGRCSAESPCVDFDMNGTQFRTVVDSVFQLDGQQSNTTFAWYKSDFTSTNMNHFNELQCGRVYYFVVRPGTSSISIPGLYITTSSSSALYEFDDTGRVTSDCNVIPPTPSPIEDCCDEFPNSVSTMGTLEDQTSISGVKVFAFEYGGKLCYDDLSITNLPGRYNFMSEDGDISGFITTTGEFINRTIRYESVSGDCYETIAETQSGFNILRRR